MLLVTTALEDTWGSNEEILFLGDWCKLYERKNIWVNRKSITLEDTFSDRARRFAAYKYTDEVFDRAMTLLTDSFTGLHKTDYPIRFWKTMCEQWLRIFITSTYYNWEYVSDMIGNFQNLEII